MSNEQRLANLRGGSNVGQRSVERDERADEGVEAVLLPAFIPQAPLVHTQLDTRVDVETCGHGTVLLDLLVVVHIVVLLDEDEDGVGDHRAVVVLSRRLESLQLDSQLLLVLLVVRLLLQTRIQTSELESFIGQRLVITSL